MPTLGFDPWIFVKLLFLFGIGIYLVFATVVVRQVYLMTTTLKLGLEFFVRFIGWAHLFIAVSIFFIALLSL